MRTVAPRGFTLIEALIYFVLTSLLITGVLAASYPIFTNTERTSAAVLRDLESAFVFQKIAYLMNSASAMTVPGSGASGAVLTLIVEGEVYSFELDGGAVTLNDIPLTSERVEIENLTFTRATLSGAPDILTVDFDANGVSQGPYTRYVRF